jgi:aminotransferase
MALMEPGDEVIVPEPFYENYGPDAILAGRESRVRAARSAQLVARSGQAAQGSSPSRTKAIIVNTPHNPDRAAY